MNQKEILILSITVFLTVVMWIVADLYHVSQQKKVHVANPRYAKEIRVNLNSQVLDILKNKE